MPWSAEPQRHLDSSHRVCASESFHEIVVCIFSVISTETCNLEIELVNFRLRTYIVELWHDLLTLTAIASNP